MRQLAFLGDLRPRIETAGAASVVPLVGGVVGDAVWLFPDIPSERRWRSRVPPAIEDAVPRLMPAGHEKALDRPLVWLQVPLPAGTRGVASQITRFAVNCVTASNIEVWSEQIDFPRLGQSCRCKQKQGEAQQTPHYITPSASRRALSWIRTSRDCRNGWR